MKLLIAPLIAIAIAAFASSALAATKTATIDESAQIVPGNSFSAYLVRDEIVTQIQDAGAPNTPAYGTPPVVRVSFDSKPSWYLVKRVTWDRVHRHLTIDF